MDIWLHIKRRDGNFYRVGDVVTVYELAPGEEVPDFSHLRNRLTGEAKYATLGVTNLPARITDLDQVRDRFFNRAWNNTTPAADPDEPDDEEFVAKREIGIDPTHPSFVNLFTVEPYRDTVTWGQLVAGTQHKRLGRRIRDSDVPDARP